MPPPPTTMDALPLHVKQAGILWFAGFREACCLHRVIIFCRSSRRLLIRTGQCFLLNGIIFLGSLFILNAVVIPILWWILPDKCEELGSWDLCSHKSALRLYSSLRSVLIELFYIFWFYPLYAFSFILSGIWYIDIAKNAFVAMGRYGHSAVESPSKNEPSDSHTVDRMDRPAGFERVLIGIGEQVYSVILLGIFFIEVLATGYIPFIGKAINFILLSWMYAYYCFEYKWNLSDVSLDTRLDFFESNWAFFAGFGSPCALPIFFFSPLVSYGVMGILYPLFVVTAIGTQAEQVINSHRRYSKVGPKKLPIFYAANTVLMQVLQLFPEVPNKQQ